MDVGGNFTTYTASGYQESGRMLTRHTNSNIGARFGIGLSDKTDLKFRYEHMVTSNVDELSTMTYFSIIPKFALTADEFSFLIPLSVYTYKNDYWNSGTVGSIAPQLLYTWTTPKKKADFTLGVKGDLLFANGGAALLFAGSLGAGFSTDLSRWAIRPEIGASFISGVDLSYGLGFQYNLPKRIR